MATQIYIHIWEHNGEELIMEHPPIGTQEEAIKEYDQQDMTGFAYKRTLLVSYTTILGESLVSEIDIRELV